MLFVCCTIVCFVQCNIHIRAGYSVLENIQPLFNPYIESGLCLPNSEHLCATCGTCSLSSRLPVLHGYGLGVLHFLLGTAFYTVCLHLVYLLFDICGMDDKLFLVRVSIVEGSVEIEVTKA